MDIFTNISKLKLFFGEKIVVFGQELIAPVYTKEICTIKPVSVNTFVQEGDLLFIHLAFILYNPVSKAKLEYADLMKLVENDKNMQKMMLGALNFFIEEPVIYLFALKQFFVEQGKKTTVLSEVLFEAIQTSLEQVFNQQPEKKKEEEYIPHDSIAADIARKLKEGKEKLRKLKQKKGGLDVFDMVKIIAAHTSKSLEEIQSMSFVALQSIITELAKKDTYELAIQAKMNGAKKITLKHWLEKD